MTIGELATRVKAVRDAQKLYFETRDRGNLISSRRLERDLDALVSALLDLEASRTRRTEPLPGQGELFEDAGD